MVTISDGVHLTTRGYGVLWKEVTRVIKVDFKGRGLDWEDFDDLPRRVPMSVDTPRAGSIAHLVIQFLRDRLQTAGKCRAEDGSADHKKEYLTPYLTGN